MYQIYIKNVNISEKPGYVHHFWCHIKKRTRTQLTEHLSLASHFESKEEAQIFVDQYFSYLPKDQIIIGKANIIYPQQNLDPEALQWHLAITNLANILEEAEKGEYGSHYSPKNIKKEVFNQAYVLIEERKGWRNEQQ